MHRFLLFVGMGTALIATGACSGPPPTPLGAAALQNDPGAIRRLLAGGHPPDESGESGITALMWAARAGALDAITALLDAGADVNARDRNNRWTPLLHAIHKQQELAVSLLLERGADPDAAAPGGLTPLIMAADDPHPDMVVALLAYGADPRVEGVGGRTALTQALSGGAFTDIDRPLLGGCRPATVKALLAHDPALTVPKTAAGRQALWWVRFHDCEDVLAMTGEPRLGPGYQIVSGVARDTLKPAERPTRPDRP
jgi:ankyrin repeat protein